MFAPFRSAFRSFRRHPVLTGVAVVTIALGSAMSVALVCLVEAIATPRSLGDNADLFRYVYVSSSVNRLPLAAVPYRELEVIRDQKHLFQDAFMVASVRDRARVGEAARIAQGEMVTGRYFAAIGATLQLGRRLSEDDDRPTSAPAVVISHELWQEHFAAVPDVIGRTLELALSLSHGYSQWTSYTVVGVTAPGFKGLGNPWSSTDYWVPFWHRANQYSIADGAGARPPEMYYGLPVVVLKAAGVEAQAADFISRLGREIRPRVAPRQTGWTLYLADSRVVRLPFDPAGKVIPDRLAMALLAMTLAVLLIALTNVASMLRARAKQRLGDMVVRRMLGASRRAIAAEIMVESGVIGLIGCTAGGILAMGLLAWFQQTLPESVSGWSTANLNVALEPGRQTYLAVATVGILTWLVTGVGPALTVTSEVFAGTSATSLNSRLSSSRLRPAQWFVALQFAVAIAVGVLGATLTRTALDEVWSSPGYDGNAVTLHDYEWPSDTDTETEAQLDGLFGILNEISRRPGITHVSAAVLEPGVPVPLPGGRQWVVGQGNPGSGDTTGRIVAKATVSADYFSSLQIGLVSGRLFDQREESAGFRSAVVSEDLAEALWPGAAPLDRRVGLGTEGDPNVAEWYTVVGVVQRVRSPTADQEMTPALYLPMQRRGRLPMNGVTILVKGASDRSTLRDVTGRLAPNALALTSRTFDEGVMAVRYPRLISAIVVGLAAILSIALAGTGLFGVVVSDVVRRSQELAIRMAVGGSRRHVLQLMLSERAVTLLTGLSSGAILAILTHQIVSSRVIALPQPDGVAVAAALAVLVAAVIVPTAGPILMIRRDSLSKLLRPD